MRKALVFLFVLMAVASSCNRSNDSLIIACGWDEVFISDISSDIPAKVWSWTADSSVNLPASMRYKFLTTDECKPVNNGRDILITSSGGGIALIDIETKDARFWASVPNAHSAELLPGDRIIVAGSLSTEGNRLNLYNISEPEKVIFTDTLYSGHGVLWDTDDKLLWALGYQTLKAYELEDWDSSNPKLSLKKQYHVPDKGGHDLMFLDKDICITTGSSVLMFDPEREVFEKHPLIGNEHHVKAVSYNSRTGETAYMKASDENWWGYYIRFTGSDRVVYLPYEKLYKVRWLQ